MKRAFTLMEVIATLVIISVIALIAVPIVTSIIDKSEKKSYKESINNYAHAIETAIALYKMENGYYAKSINDLKVEYTGSKVQCNEIEFNNDGTIYMSQCVVNSIKVRDKTNDDGWYHYGKIKYDFSIGELVQYNGISFYVLNNVKTDDDVVTLLKAEPFKVSEINKYGTGHINNNSNWNLSDRNIVANYYKDYGFVAYYSSEECGYYSVGTSYGYYSSEQCTTDYKYSDVKYIVDAWAEDNLNYKDLVEDELGYSVRLISYNDVKDYMSGYQIIKYNDWIGFSYGYWTMINADGYNYSVYDFSDGWANISMVNCRSNSYRAIRPVINIRKEAIGG